MSVTIKDNTDAVLKELDNAMERALTRIGLAAEGYAKKSLTAQGAVDTGLLRNSVTFALSGEGANTTSYKADRGGETGHYTGTAPNDKDKAVYIGSNVEYAIFIENGARGQSPRPFLKPAATEHTTTYKNILKEELGK